MLERKEQFNVTWGPATDFVMTPGGADFMLSVPPSSKVDRFMTNNCRSGDTKFHSNQRQLMHKALYRDNWHKEVKEFYEYITLRLLHEKSCKIAGINQVDITRE